MWKSCPPTHSKNVNLIATMMTNGMWRTFLILRNLFCFCVFDVLDSISPLLTNQQKHPLKKNYLNFIPIMVSQPHNQRSSCGSSGSILSRNNQADPRAWSWPKRHRSERPNSASHFGRSRRHSLARKCTCIPDSGGCRMPPWIRRRWRRNCSQCLEAKFTVEPVRVTVEGKFTVQPYFHLVSGTKVENSSTSRHLKNLWWSQQKVLPDHLDLSCFELYFPFLGQQDLCLLVV